MGKQIEFTEDEPVKIGRESYPKGDRKTFPDEVADEYVRLGWAKNVDTGEQGTRVPGAQKLQVDDAVIKAF